MKERQYYASGVAMYAMEQLLPVSIMVYERGPRGLRIARGFDNPSSSASAQVKIVHVLHTLRPAHYVLLAHAPVLNTLLGQDISLTVAEAVDANRLRHGDDTEKPSMKRPAVADPAGTPSLKKRLTSKQSVEPSRSTVLNVVAGMTGGASGGKQKAVKVMKRKGFAAAAAKRAVAKLMQEKAIYLSQTRRSIHDGSGVTKKWRALRADKTKVRAANLFKL